MAQGEGDSSVCPSRFPLSFNIWYIQPFQFGEDLSRFAQPIQALAGCDSIDQQTCLLARICRLTEENLRLPDDLFKISQLSKVLKLCWNDVCIFLRVH